MNEVSLPSPKNIRKRCRLYRQQLSDAHQLSASKALCQRVAQLSQDQHWQHVAVYLAQDGEIDLALCIQQLWQLGVRCYLPIVEAGAPDVMQFAHYQKNTKLTVNQYGILQPENSINRTAADCDAILMPLVAFDAQGARLGMGGGYYDRTLAFKLERPESKPQLIGVAHQGQQVTGLKPEAWDVPLEAVITGQGYQWFGDPNSN